MKKVVFAAFTLITLSAHAAQGQSRTPAAIALTKGPSAQNAPTLAIPAIKSKAVVQLDALPAAVKATLASPSLKAWLPTEAFLIKDTHGKEYYAINIKHEARFGSVQIDKNGKPVR